jgi:hypothetical protein
MKRMSIRRLNDVLLWLDINKTTIYHIKTQAFILLIHEEIVCLLGWDLPD